MTVFALHEDDWAMVELLPAENMPFIEAELARIDQQSQKHAAAAGWTDLTVIQHPPTTLLDRHISLEDVRADIAGRLPEASALTTGYGGTLTLEPSRIGFAFGEPYGDLGGLYGEQQAGEVCLLGLSGNWGAPLVAELLHTWGTRYHLLLVDWFQMRALLLNDPEHLTLFLNGDDD